LEEPLDRTHIVFGGLILGGGLWASLGGLVSNGVGAKHETK